MSNAPSSMASEADPIARARALQPLVREAAEEAERERHLSARVAEAMADAGLYRVAAPRTVGGAEAPPAVQIQTIEAISEADGSAGWNLMIGIETLGLLAAGFERDRRFADPRVILCSSSAAVGRAEAADGGFRVSGQWPYVSGCHNSHYFAGIVAVYGEDGEPVPGPPRYALTDRDSIEILDTWHVSGLRGSGSHDVRLEGVFVPEADTVPLVPGATPGGGGGAAVARIPLGSRLAYNKVGVALGIARAAIDAFVELATGKVPWFTSTTLREKPHVHHAVAVAESRLRGARAFVMEAVHDLWETVCDGRGLTGEQRALLQLACSDSVLVCAEVVDRVALAAGTTANRLDCALERYARDVRVVRQHATVGPQHIDDAGRVLLGLEPEGLMLATLAGRQR